MGDLNLLHFQICLSREKNRGICHNKNQTASKTVSDAGEDGREAPCAESDRVSAEGQREKRK